MPGQDFVKLFDQFRQLKVMVIGDVMVDAYIFGRVDRISPEAPVPVVSVEKRTSRLGGAANVALNIKSLGGEPILCSVTGQDSKGEEFRQLLHNEGIGSEYIIASSNRVTTTKFRVIGNKTQMIRVDEEVTHDLTKEDELALIDTIRRAFSTHSIDAVIFQDYNKGVLTQDLIAEVIRMSNQKGIPVAVDPKKNNFFSYKQVSFFKPNMKELKEGLNLGDLTPDVKSLSGAVKILHDKMNIGTVMVTLSENGVFISNSNAEGGVNCQVIPAHLRKISDVSGAGDSVISVAGMALACRLEPAAIAALANLAGGLVCEEVGVVPVNREKLLDEALSLL